MDLRPAKYLTIVALALVVMALVLVGLNWFANPYGITGTPNIEGVNAEKPRRFAHGGRVTRSFLLRSGRFDTVLLGSSRVMVGLDPESPAFDGASVFNAALPGTNIRETVQVTEYAVTTQQLDRIVLGIDFLMFSDAREHSGDFLESGFAGFPAWQAYGRRFCPSRRCKTVFRLWP